MSAQLNAAIDVYTKNDNGEMPLHNAVEKGQDQVVEALLAAGLDVDVHTEEEYGCYTPLHCVSYAGHVEVMKALLAAGANVDAKDKCGRTPLVDITIYKKMAEILRDAVKKTKLKG